MENECFNPEIKLLIALSTDDLHNAWNMGSLSAPYWRFYWNDAKGAFITSGGVKRSLGPEKMTLIAPNTDFSASCPGHARQYYVHFVTGPPYSNVKPGIFEFPIEDEALLALLKRAMAISVSGSKERLLKSLLALRAVLSALEHLPADLLNVKRLDPRVVVAMEKLTPGRRIRSNEELANEAGMSSNAFLRLFRQESGVSPQLYNRRRRIEEACLLLHHSQLDIKAIAERLGFCDRYHFSRIFRQLRGVSPAEFRRRQSAGGLALVD